LIGSREAGNETYTLSLLQALSQLPGVKCGAAILPNTILPEYLSDVEPVPLRSSNNWGRILYALRVACRDWCADILHVNYIAPFFVSCPIVTTVHDVSFKRFPEFFSLRDRLLFATLLPVTLRRVSAVIAVSHHAKQEIVDVYRFLKDKVYVTMEASNPMFGLVRDEALLQSARLRYGIHSDYVLAVGNLQPRKNLSRLISAFDRARREIKCVQLVIVGKDQWRFSHIYDAVKKYSLENDVVFTGYIPDKELVLLYNSAKVFVYPSLYEGFGLPILEAMSCGVPVVTSNVSSVPEVAGGCALLVDPNSVDQIACAILQILNNNDLALSLSEKGLERVKQFSWLKTAQETLTVYKKVLDQHNQ
jgi:glycosyltransferase involved in cell wall biosynthesis